MSKSKQKEFRKRHLFARSLGDVVKQATQPLMNKQGKLYGALLRDWATIVGPERAAVTKPDRIQFASGQSPDATLHLAVRPAAAPELAYVTEQILEQCARYFGYRAITRVVLHPTHGMFDTKENTHPSPDLSTAPKPLPANIPADMQGVLGRIAAHLSSTIVKKDGTR